MRLLASIALASVVLAASARGEGTEPMTLLSLYSTRHASHLRTAFHAPAESAAQDLSDDAVTVTIGGDAAVVVDASTRGVRISRDGRRFRFRAPKSSSLRLRKLQVATNAGTFAATLGGAHLDSRHPPLVRVEFAGHVYVFDPATLPPAPAPGPLPPPVGTPIDGPVAFTDVARMVAMVTPPVTNTVIRSSTEMYYFTSKFTFTVGVPVEFSYVDFSKEMVVVAVGDPTGGGILPWSVRVASTTMQSGRLVVAYDRYWGPICCIDNSGTSTGSPPYAAFFHAVKIPRTDAPVDFVATPVKRQIPWY